MKLFALSIDATPGAMQAVLPELGWPSQASPGTYYDVNVYCGDRAELVRLQDKLAERGYVSELV